MRDEVHEGVGTSLAVENARREILVESPAYADVVQLGCRAQNGRWSAAVGGERILPTIPRRAPWRHKAAMRHKEFVYVPALDRYRCPRGRRLYRQDTTPTERVRYRTHEYACRGCVFKPRCTRAKRCTITRPARITTRDWVDAHPATARARRSHMRRCYWAETAFADLKGNHSLATAILRGPTFEVQALLAATAHNVKRLVKGRPP